MNKSSFLKSCFVSLMIVMTSLTFQLNNSLFLAEGQEQLSSMTGNSKNVTDLVNSNGKNSIVKLENKTVNYFENANGYLIYPISTSSSSSLSIENNISANNNTTFPAVVMIHENKGLNDNIKNMAKIGRAHV